MSDHSIKILRRERALPEQAAHAAKEYREIRTYLREGYKWEAFHVYTDSSGSFLFGRVRLKDPETGEKHIRPFSFSGKELQCKQPDFPNGTPLYKLKEIAANLNATVYVCEGEWACDHLNDKLKALGANNDFIATTSGSATSSRKADWSPLAGRKVIVWRDNDKPGMNYADDVTAKLAELNCTIQWVDIDVLALPDGGDVVDWLEKKGNVTREQIESLATTMPETADAVEPLFRLDDARVGDWLDNPPPARRWLLDNCLPLGKVGLVVAPGGTGKTQFALQLAVSAASGIIFAGEWRVAHPGSVLALFAEEDADELHRRLRYTVEDLTDSMPDADRLQAVSAISERPFIRSMRGRSNALGESNQYGDIEETDYVARLLKTMKSIANLSLVILDPAARFRGGDENSSVDTTRFVEACERISQETGATLLVMHHTNKSSSSEEEPTQNASRGSSALTDGIRWQMNLATMTVKQAKDNNIERDRCGYYLRATITKRNYGPPQNGDVWLKRTGDHGVLMSVDLSDGKKDLEKQHIDKIVSIVKQDAQKGEEHSKTGFAKQYGGVNRKFKIGEKALGEFIGTALRKKLLVMRAPKKEQRNVSSVLAVPDSESILCPLPGTSRIRRSQARQLNDERQAGTAPQRTPPRQDPHEY